MAELEDLGTGGLGLEEGVVEDSGEVLRRGECVSGEGFGVVRRKRYRRGGGAKDGAQWCSFGATTVDSKTLKNCPLMISAATSVFFLSYEG